MEPTLLAQQALVRLLVKSDDQCFSSSQSWRAEVASRAEHVLQQSRLVRLILFDVKMNDLLALRRIDVADLAAELERFLFLERRLAGVDFLGRFQSRVCKKLLRLATRLSSGAVVTPIQFCHAGSLHLGPRSCLILPRSVYVRVSLELERNTTPIYFCFIRFE